MTYYINNDSERQSRILLSVSFKMVRIRIIRTWRVIITYYSIADILVSGLFDLCLCLAIILTNK